MARRFISFTLAAFTMASAASMHATNPLVSIMPRARDPGSSPSSPRIISSLTEASTMRLFLPESNIPVNLQGVQNADDRRIHRRCVYPARHAGRAALADHHQFPSAGADQVHGQERRAIHDAA